MDGPNGIERRRAPRCAVRSDVQCRLDVRLRVQVVDISATGALLATETALPVGSAAVLKSGMGAATFASDVQIRRLGKTAGRPAVGVMFTTTDDRNRRNLDQFLKKASA